MEYKGLIVGLGNPGPKYETTRHNYGFMLVDAILDEIASKSYRRKEDLASPDSYNLWAISLPRVKGDFLLAKPLTYMNLSGKAVVQICSKYGIKPDRVLVAHDEMDLPVGRLKMKIGGGVAGHNGLSSIIEETGSNKFMRMRLGIGRPPAHTDVKNYVLEPFSDTETTDVQAVLKRARDGVSMVYARGFQAAQQEMNSFRLPDPEKTEDSRETTVKTT